MKTFLLIALTLLTLSVYSQADSTKKHLNCYVSGSFSTSVNDNFKQGSYAGLELGVCLKNLMFGVASGRGNLDFSTTGIQDYWFEVKAYACLPIGAVKGFAVAGWGQYYGTNHSFIEYGVGAAYSVKQWDFSLTVSNWDRVVYLSPGVTFNFAL
ncbi:MAG: hypothetical protein IPN95_19730 [Bacteroidetes bacterium]|nr:hypothetical protein [Bacteroidota bacterium]